MSTLAVPGGNIAQVFQWHGDTFDLPKGALLLASSALYPNQAFRYGDRVYALQFHIEVTPEIVRDWLSQEQGIDFAAITVESGKIYHSYRERAGKFYRLFSEMRNLVCLHWPCPRRRQTGLKSVHSRCWRLQRLR
jgi:hypothetical protein